jgi:hypothetical protein
MALAEGVAGPLGRERAVGGIGSIRSSRRAPRPLAASKADVSTNQPQNRHRLRTSPAPESSSPPRTPHRPQRQLNVLTDKPHSAGVQHFASFLFTYG